MFVVVGAGVGAEVGAGVNTGVELQGLAQG